jgi:hypothetical protein
MEVYYNTLNIHQRINVKTFFGFSENNMRNTIKLVNVTMEETKNAPLSTTTHFARGKSLQGKTKKYSKYFEKKQSIIK